MDVTDVILRDHAWFREQFVALYDLRARLPPDIEAISEVWDPLAARLDVHAAGEEEIFYPQLLARGEDPEEETLDAIGDHNDIRDGLHAAGRHPVASEEWWAAVGVPGLEPRGLSLPHRLRQPERDGDSLISGHPQRLQPS